MTLIQRFMLALSLLATIAIGAAAKAQTDNIRTITVMKGISFVHDTNGKTDFAELERLFPVDRTSLDTWVQADLATLNQEQLDQLYARLTAGPIPDGAYSGKIVFEADGGFEGVVQKYVPVGPLVSAEFGLLHTFAEYMWRGKHFYRQESVLRNLIPDSFSHRLLVQSIAFGLLGSFADPSKMVHTEVAGKSYLELFPAKLGCGASMLDNRRESVVIDYAEGENLPGYYPEVDALATRNILSVRDEIRMIHPGLYLGRAYVRGVFGLVFTLSNADAAQKGDRTESCATGI